MDIQHRSNLLKQFLMEENALPQFLLNARIFYGSDNFKDPDNIFNHLCNRDDPSDVFNAAFVFDTATEGFDYWNTLRLKWKAKFKKV